MEYLSTILKARSTRQLSKPLQYGISIAAVLGMATICMLSTELIGYRVVALILLMTVSVIAMLFDILPVMIAAVLSAVIWNLLFIPPLYTFHISNAEDSLMFLMYFVIALVNAALTFQIRRAERTAREKEERKNAITLYNALISSLSHEIRTPISTIIGAIDTLKENAGTLSVSNQQELLTEIDLASMRLNRQVGNLLNMNRLKTGMLQLKKDWCDVNELLFGVIQKLEPVLQKHVVRFQPDEQLPLFKLDGGLIEQVFYNIIHNAVQYTPAGSTIRINAQHQSGYCIITITDNGDGISEPERQNVFEMFYRIPNTKTGGSGLGLAIAKGFVEAHHGSITLTSETGKGATFTITIPAETSFITNLKHE